MNGPEDELLRLLDRIEGMPDGTAKIELLNEAARLADTREEVETGFLLRKILMGTSLNCGQPDQMSVAFAWCVSQSDRHPDRIAREQILWEYRWVVSELPQFPQVSRPQIEATIEEMTRRYREAGSTLRPVHLAKLFTYTKMGDREAAAAARRDWAQAGRDSLSDSHRQEVNLLVNYLAFAGHSQEAVERSTRVLAGWVDEPEFFGQDSAELLLPLLEMGRVSDAIRVQRSGYRYLAGKPAYIAHIAFHVEFLARLDHFPEAVRIAEAHLPIAIPSRALAYRTHFLRSLLILVERMRRTGHSTFPLRAQAGLPLAADRLNQCDAGELARWLTEEVSNWSGRFDARNGNRYFAEKLAAVDELVHRPVPVV